MKKWFRKITAGCKKLPVGAAISAGTLLALLSTNAYAFKVSTHAWVAQQVINELNSCREIYQKPCIRIDLDGVKRILPVDPATAEAILKYPEFFRNGNIGPDAYPDILVGQSVIHPGITQQNADKSETVTGFGTSDWLINLRERVWEMPEGEDKKKAMAFVFGFFAHAAADVWAHTYVNTYAGDQFSLLDGETDIERRHIALEDYIAQKTPDIVDHNGQALGKAHQLISSGKNAAVPADFVRQKIIWEGQKELEKVATSKHLVLVYKLHQKLVEALQTEASGMSNLDFAKSVGRKLADSMTEEEYRTRSSGEMFDHIADRVESYKPEGGAIQKIEIVAIQIVAYYFLGVDLSAKEAAKAAEILNSLQNAGGDSMRNLFAKSQLIQEKSIALQKMAAAADANAAAQIADALNSFTQSLARHAQLESQLINSQIDLDRKNQHKISLASRKLCTIAATSTCDRHMKTITSIVKQPCMKERCINIGGIRKCKNVPDFCDISKSTLEKTPDFYACNRAIDACKATHDQHNAQMRSASDSVTAAFNQVERIKREMLPHELLAKKSFQLLRDLAAWVHEDAVRKQRTLIALESDVTSLIADVTTGHRGLLNVWVTDIEEAMRQWVIANGNAIRAAIDEDVHTTLMGTLSEWKALYFPSILGVNQKLINLTVGRVVHVRNEYDSLWLKMEDKARQIDPKIIGRFLDKRDQTIKESPFVVAETLDKPFSDLVGTKKYALALTVHAAHSDISRDRFNEIFEGDTTAKNLLKFEASGGSIADRVDVDMRLVNDQFDPERFVPIRNAVTFAKMALLGHAGVQTLIGKDLYKTTFGDEILSSFLVYSLRSIDGNHQWMGVAPPYPRRGGWTADTAWNGSCLDRDNVSRRFSPIGFFEHFKVGGFALFRHLGLRTEVFHKLFRGLMNEGLFKSKDHGFDELITDDVPYLVCQ